MGYWKEAGIAESFKQAWGGEGGGRGREEFSFEFMLSHLLIFLANC